MNEIKGKNVKLFAVLSYLWPTCMFPLLFAQDDFVKFHAKQGLALSIIQIATIFFFIIPVLGWILGMIIIFITVLAIKSVLSGGMWRIPYIYELSKRIKIN